MKEQRQPRNSRWGIRQSDDPEASRLTTRASLELPLASLLKAHPPAVAGMQVRTFNNAAIAITRGDIELSTVVGLVAPYETVVDLGDGAELYRRGCFDSSLSADDPLCLVNLHLCSLLGRKSSGTARFNSQRDGLHYEVDPPDTQRARDLLVSMRRGDINSSCSAIYIQECDNEIIGGQRVRVITEAQLIAVGPSSSPRLKDAGISTDAAIVEARITGFKNGLAEGRRERAAQQGARHSIEHARAMRLVTPTERIARDFQQRMGTNV